MDIKRLKRKRKWTGRELGQVLTLITCLQLDAITKEQPYPPERQELIEMYRQHENDIVTERDNTDFYIYRSLFDGIVSLRNVTAGQQQQLLHGVYKNLHFLDSCYSADEAEAVADMRPLTMTKSQHSRYMYEARERLETSKEDSFFTVFYKLLGYYLEDGRRAPAIIKTAIRATKGKPATNQRILSTYNRHMKRGFYTLPDGRRSDQTDPKEWRRAVKELFPIHKPSGNDIFFTHAEEREALFYEKLFYNDKLPLPERKMLLIAKIGERVIDQLRKGEAPAISPEDFNKVEMFLYGSANFPKWDYYTDLPEVSKYDLLCACFDEYRGEGKSGKVKITLYKELSADYPELVKALEALIKEKLPSLSGLTVSHYNKNIVTRAELAGSGLADFDKYESGRYIESIISEIIEDEEPGTFASYRKSSRVKRGISVIQNPADDQTDERGDYVENEEPYIIDTIETVHGKEEIDFSYHSLINGGLRYIYAYNGLVDVLQDFFDIDMLDVFKINEQETEEKIDGYNGYIFQYYGKVYGDDQTKKHKRELIRDTFQPIKADELRPSAEALEDVADFFNKEGMTRHTADRVSTLYRFVDNILRR